MKKIFLIIPLIAILSGFINDKKKYKISKTLDVQINDTNSVFVNQVVDKTSNNTVFYYSDLVVPACNTGECRLIEIRMYWDCFGNYFKYSVKKRQTTDKV